ncbi:MAG: glycoside hydrolase family 3 N-terminal domain-containing protein [Brooklawnia sp.]
MKSSIVVDGEEFKDLNGSKSLDAYEDWRLPAAERAADLVSQMNVDEKAGLMLIDTLNAGCDGAVPELAEDYLNTQQMCRFIFRNSIDVTVEGECEESTSIFKSPKITVEAAAKYTNGVQEMAEASRLGIPVLFKSNARNHLDPSAVAGVNQSAGAFTSFPKESGIAAAALGEQAVDTAEATTGDPQVIQDFAATMGSEWHAVGIRGMYGYMADLATEPRWYRTHETFTEDADLATMITTNLITTLQGEVDPATGSSLSPSSDVALTFKHFPGGGPQELGLDPHYSFGKTQVYPGEAFAEHLKPFEAAVEAGVSSIMPYYGVPMDVSHGDVTFQETGFAFSDQIVNGLLREELGFTGYVNSDTGIVETMAWGLESSTVPERVAAAVNSGTDTLSGFNSVETLTDMIDSGLLTEERVDEAATRLLIPLFELGLFEDPYVDEAAAVEIVGSRANREVGLDTQRKSLVMPQNEQVDGAPALPLPQAAKLYILAQDAEAERLTQAATEAGYSIVDDPADADRVIISMTAGVDSEAVASYESDDPATGLNPEYANPIEAPGLGLDGTSPYGAADQCNSAGAEECTDSSLRYGGSFPWESGILDFTGMEEAESWKVSPSLTSVQEVMAQVDPEKVVLSIYFRQPYVLDEASGLRDAGAILANFGVTETALFDVLSGEYAPQGRMPFALAGTREAIAEQMTDLPGYKETTDGELFPYGHGLTYE